MSTNSLAEIKVLIVSEDRGSDRMHEWLRSKEKWATGMLKREIEGHKVNVTVIIILPRMPYWENLGWKLASRGVNIDIGIIGFGGFVFKLCKYTQR